MDQLLRLLTILLIVIVLLLFIVYIYNIYIVIYERKKRDHSIKKIKKYDDSQKKVEDINQNINQYNNQYNYELLPSMKDKLSYCTVPTLTTEQCYKSRHYECPVINGSYLQCTNNYIPKPTEYNADCGNRTFDMVPPPWKISENCYYNKIGFDREKEYNKVLFL